MLAIHINQDNYSNDTEALYSPTDESPSSNPSTHPYLHEEIERKIYESYDLPITTSLGYALETDSQDKTNNYDPQSKLFPDSPHISNKQKRFLQFQRGLRPNQTPSNHRRQFMDVTEPPRPFGHVLNGKRPASFQPRPNMTYPNIPKDYIGPVDSIQDIINQITHQVQGSRYESLPAYVARTGRKVRFGGTYRHRKNDEMLPNLHHSLSGFRSEATGPSFSLTPTPAAIGNDPFYPYKPQSMAEINLMAMHEFRFAPKPPMPDIHHSYRKDSNKPNHLMSDMYQQLIRANNMRDESDRLASRDGQTKMQKPFSLMLDVYPIHDDEMPSYPATPTRRPDKRPVIRKPLPYDNLYTQHAHNSINNFPLHYEHQYFQNIKFPQISPYANHVRNHHQESENSNYYNPKHLNQHFNRLGSAARIPISHANENRPSQITVHLNLFPKNKQSSSLHQRRQGIRTGDLTKTGADPSKPSPIIQMGQPNSSRKPHSLETPYYDHLAYPSSLVSATSVGPQTTSDAPTITEAPIVTEALVNGTVLPFLIVETGTTPIPTPQATLQTQAPPICSTPPMHVTFDDQRRFVVSTDLPIDPRNIPSSK